MLSHLVWPGMTRRKILAKGTRGKRRRHAGQTDARSPARPMTPSLKNDLTHFTDSSTFPNSYSSFTKRPSSVLERPPARVRPRPPTMVGRSVGRSVGRAEVVQAVIFQSGSLAYVRACVRRAGEVTSGGKEWRKKTPNYDNKGGGGAAAAVCYDYER